MFVCRLPGAAVPNQRRPTASSATFICNLAYDSETKIMIFEERPSLHKYNFPQTLLL
jgi:hypothetical protein